MLNTKLGRNLSVVLCSVVISACHTTIPIKNKKTYFSAGDRGAFWTETLTTREGTLTPAEWAVKREELACTEVSSFNDTETAIDQFCNAYAPVCEFEDVQEEIKRTKATIARLKRVAKRAISVRATSVK